MMDLLKRFTDVVHRHNLFQKDDLLIVAVSGGADSVVLCDLCCKTGFTFAAAHCNFKLRGEESDRDEQFVKDLAGRYNVAFANRVFDTAGYAEKEKVSTQLAARELRYTWFKELLNDGLDEHHLWQSPKLLHAKKYLLTAHHADDNIETVLLNFMKGTGLDGLTGIAQKRNDLVRPLLFASKENILEYAAENKLAYVEDSSNSSEKYTRNFIRHTIISNAESIVPKIRDNVSKNIERFNGINLVFNSAITQLKSKLLTKKGDEFYLPVFKLVKQPGYSTILFEILKDYNFTPHQLSSIVQLLQSETGKHVRSSTHIIFRNRNWLIIAPNKTEYAETILIENTDESVTYNKGSHTLDFRAMDSAAMLPLNINSDEAYIDFNKMNFPLLLRKWKAGDYFYPLGMKKKKKLNRFLIDQKLSITEKEKVYVIEMDKKIIWLVGYRIDDRFKITGSTQQILKLSVSQIYS